MTGTDLLTNALALMNETDTTSHEATAVAKINLVLVETYHENNRIRRSKDMESLTSIPVISALTETLTYENELLYRVLPLGLVCRLFVDEDNIPVLSMYKQEYASAIKDEDRNIATSVYHSRRGG